MEMDGSSDQNMAKRKLPAQATVFSKRVPRTGVSMLETAEAKAVMKNLEAPGMHITNPFAILQKVNNSSLSFLAVNCGIQLQSDDTSEYENLSLLRAKEMAQAAIQQAIECKKKREELAADGKYLTNLEVSDSLEELVNPPIQENGYVPKKDSSPQKKRGEKQKRRVNEDAFLEH